MSSTTPITSPPASRKQKHPSSPRTTHSIKASHLTSLSQPKFPHPNQTDSLHRWKSATNAQERRQRDIAASLNLAKPNTPLHQPSQKTNLLDSVSHQLQVPQYHHTNFLSQKTWKRLLAEENLEEDPNAASIPHHNQDPEFSMRFHEQTTKFRETQQMKKEAERQHDREHRIQFGNKTLERQRNRLKQQRLHRERQKQRNDQIHIWSGDSKYREIQRLRRQEMQHKRRMKHRKDEVKLKPASTKVMDAIEDVDLANERTQEQLQVEMAQLFEESHQRRQNDS